MSEEKKKDVLTPDQRLRSMQSNRGRTKPERLLASCLWKQGLRFYTSDGFKRITGKALPGSPDLIFSRKKIAIFVDGCFWHGCPKCKGIPLESGGYWKNKIIENVQRDIRNNEQLKEIGWGVFRVWEHSLKKDKIAIVVDDIKSLISSH